jgi:glutamine synthetase
MLEEMGFEIESSHHESAPAQHEIDFKEGEAMRIADMIQTFRFAVRSIAKRFGLYATFMPKPKTDVAGSGMHINFALIRDGKNVFRSENGGITEEARYFIGGLLAHADALAAVANPTVNSYKRLAGGYRSCDTLRWACKGEKTLIKLNEDIDDTKIELRFPDGSANPYLLFACALAAGMEGIKNMTEPGEEMGGKDVLPDNIREAVGRLQKDETLNTVLGRDFVNVLAEIKNAEWSDFMSEVSEWELARYLNKI